MARVDARRPASWMALLIGACAGWCVAAAKTHPWSIGLAITLPAAGGVASIGNLPIELCRGASRHSPTRLAALWAAERAAWPLVGSIIAAAATAASERSWPSHGVWPLAAAPLAALSMVVAGLWGAGAADAAALALALAGASAAAALAAQAAGAGIAGAIAAAGATWCLVATVARSWPRRPPRDGPTDAGLERLHLPLPSAGGVQDALEKVAMGTALAAMAGWLVMHAGDREVRHPQAWPWALLSATWFVCLAVPRATLLDGVCGAAAWEQLFRTAAAPEGRQHRGWWTLTGLPVGGGRFGVAAALAAAAVLGWPPLVGGLLLLSRPAHAWPPLAIVLGLAAAAALLAALVLTGTRAGVDRESLCAAALAVVVGVAMVCQPVGSSATRGRHSTASPISPRLPSFGPRPVVGAAAPSFRPPSSVSSRADDTGGGRTGFHVE